MKWVCFFVCMVAQSLCANFFSYIPTSKTPTTQVMNTSKGFTYEDSLWAQWVSVDSVHHITLMHSDTDSAKVWSLGIGKGSQIFSLQGAFGECIPPQNHPGGPWIDEVVQMVAVNRAKNNREKIRTIDVYYEDTLGNERTGASGSKDSAYFIHQAGTYQRDTALLNRNNFSPIIAEESTHNRFATICWPQQAHVHNIHTSEALYWQVIQDMGSGVIEITYAVYNYGDTPLDYFNMPWGGVRHSTLPHHLLSNPDGSYEVKSGKFGDALLSKLRDTDGWALFTQENSDSSFALSYVFGQDKHLDELSPQQWDNSYWRYGSAAAYMGAYPGVGPRDFFVSAVNPRVSVEKNELFYWRWYMIVGTQKDVIPLARERKDSVEYGFLSFETIDASALTLYKNEKTLSHENNGVAIGTLYDRPTAETKPLFLMRHKSDSTYLVATNPNIYNDSLMTSIGMVYRPYLSRYVCEKLLGFATEEQYTQITAQAATLKSTYEGIKQSPAAKCQHDYVLVNNLHTIDEVRIYNMMGQELHRATGLKSGTYQWQHSSAANFLLVKCYRNDRATAIIPVTIY